MGADEAPGVEMYGQLWSRGSICGRRAYGLATGSIDTNIQGKGASRSSQITVISNPYHTFRKPDEVDMRSTIACSACIARL